MIQQTSSNYLFPEMPEEIVETIFSYIDSENEVEKLQLVNSLWYKAGQNLSKIAWKRKFAQEFRYLNYQKPRDIKWNEFFTITEREELPKALDYAIEKFDVYNVLHRLAIKKRVYLLDKEPGYRGICNAFKGCCWELLVITNFYMLILMWFPLFLVSCSNPEHKICKVSTGITVSCIGILFTFYLKDVFNKNRTYPLATAKIMDYADRHYQITDSIKQFPIQITDSMTQFPKKASCSIL